MQLVQMAAARRVVQRLPGILLLGSSSSCTPDGVCYILHATINWGLTTE